MELAREKTQMDRNRKLAKIKELMKRSREQGMQTFDQALFDLYELGKVTYEDAPPATGPHWSVLGLAPVPIGREFYTEADSPEVEQLVHNLEHGFTVMWYDETIADDDEALTELRAIARKFSDTTDRRNAFIIAPWISEDGGDFPEGQHVALTHWSAGGAGETDETKQLGVTQYCSGVSGEAVDTFVRDYPQLDSPEPSVAM